MRDHATMNDTTRAWALHCTSELAHHISEALADLLPEDVRVLSAGLHIMLEKTPTGRVVSDFEVSAPADFDATTAYYVLNDLADQLSMYLHRAWPTNAGGTALHAWAGEKDGEIELAFRGEGANADAAPIALPSFPIPPRPEATVIVG